MGQNKGCALLLQKGTKFGLQVLVLLGNSFKAQVNSNFKTHKKLLMPRL
jgi:hypothetical protein